MTPKLGRLERVDLRTIWKTENVDFTPWLAEEENLKLLGDTIGMQLELEATEKNVGPFRADILCKTMYDDSWVLIENQIERTDHTHLGQLLTYGAGLDAINIVWIASRFTEEHRAALDWLNTITDEDFRFFGLEVEAWKIGDSIPAPKFNIISKPNKWSKSVSHEARRISDNALSETQAMQLRYWQQLVDYIRESGSKLLLRKPYPQNWHAFAIGHNGTHIGTIMNTDKKTIGVELCMENPNTSKKFFTLLEKEKAQIENEIGTELEWRNLEKNKGTKIIQFEKANPKDEADWERQHAWFKETVEKFCSVFIHRLQDIEL